MNPLAVPPGAASPPGSTPRTIASIFLLPTCDMHCRFCGSEETFDTLSPERASRLVRIVTEARFRSVVLGGGEPLLWPHDLLGLAREAAESDLLVQLCTNGTRLDERIASSPHIHRFILPLEGSTAACHDGARVYRPRSHFDMVLDRLKMLRKLGRQVTFSTVVTPSNADDLGAIANLIARYLERGGNVHAWHLYRFQPIGRRGVGAPLRQSDAEWKDCIDALNRDGLPFQVWVRPDMPNSKAVSFLWEANGRVETTGWPMGVPVLPEREGRAVESHALRLSSRAARQSAP